MASVSTVVKRDAAEGKEEAEYAIQPANTAPAVDPSDWPLLLKDWDKRMSSEHQFLASREGRR